jgi:protein-L-isoaspartate O-methyltransferase
VGRHPPFPHLLILAGAGTLQTRAYIDALLTAIQHRRGVPDDIADAVQVRVDKQHVVTEGDHRFAVVLEESVLRYPIGGPDFMAGMMLDQLDVQPGHRAQEIGAGTGYNAALLAYLTGPSGQVTTVDIDAKVTGRARRALDATGYGHVHVATRDGALPPPSATTSTPRTTG